MAAATQNFGLKRKGAGLAVLEPIPKAKLPDKYLLIKTVAVAVNPTDWTTLDAIGDNNTIVGCDFAGIIEEVGPAVTKRFQKGDRVAGCSHGANDANPESGAFARFIIAIGDLVLHVPDEVSWEEAATVGVAIITVGMGLYQIMGVKLPDGAIITSDQNGGDPILIYGGSTATGTIAIQFAKLSGRKVLTTCSPKHFALAKDRGADIVYDYHTPYSASEIRNETKDQLTQVYDTVSLESTAAYCSDAISSSGGLYVNLLGAKSSRSDVHSIDYLGYNASGEIYIFEGKRFPARLEDFLFARDFVAVAERLWAEGKWKAHPVRVGSGGLIGVLDGMKQMKDGKVSGEKLVYLVDETAWPIDSL
ncbi:putative zinc-binding oxidoreductase ToxD [Mariannaea sp. PMI_226]|nr:putative zinc-binding oxidoreductase ToxD [Mariannaea sp. PMI_226]